MKTIKYISILVLSACMAALSSCAEEDIVKKGTPGDGHTLLIELTADANREISPLSKASADDPQEKVTDLNILIYQNGSIIEKESQYITSGEILTKLSQPSTTGNNASAPFTLTDIEPGAKVVYVVANAGKSLINDAGAATADNLKNYKFGMNGNKPQFVMFAEGQSFDVSSNASITSSLKRIYSMVTVKMEFDNLSSSIQIIPQSLQLKHIPVTGQLKENNKISSEQECLIDGEKIEKGNSGNFLLEEHSSATPLFLYENRQPEGKYLNDERTKTPAGFPEATAMSDIIKTDRKCSYIEIVAKYIKSGNADGAGSGTITYRFFLGENATNNFDVQRNYHYKVTLSLTGDGGKDEATWRVEADLKKEMSIQDVYIGYRQGARSYVQATGDFGNATVSSNSDKISVSIDRNGKVTVTSNETNTHDYNSRTFTYTYSVNGEPKTANVIQVPRLVDPIAIYKKASNKEATTINVKAYSPTSRAYDPLQSVGPWCAIIKSASAQSSPSSSSWFKIAPKGKLDDSSETKYEVSDTIYGEGPVIFDYQPLSENTNKDRLSGETLVNESNDGARYGVILVKYHNMMCEHEIFLRQGYQPTTINGVTWSMFNCIGLNSGGDSQITEYPTETGWLFKGGMNIGMNPYSPAYGVEANVKLSNGSSSRFWDLVGDFNNWVKYSEYMDVANRNKSLQGPCPNGYKLASGADFNSLAGDSQTATTLYTGYVYDDDPVAGWSFGQNGNAVLEDNNHCNPAKGTLFVSNADKKTNIFFTHGKGVLTKHADPNLVNEIGIGHRGGTAGQYEMINPKNPQTVNAIGGFLSNLEFWDSKNYSAYGAYYWGVSLFNPDPKKYTARFSRVSLNFDILKTTPSYVDVATKNNLDSHGINGYAHGSFVRCVRSN